jgi:hypothetical protein
LIGLALLLLLPSFSHATSATSDPDFELIWCKDAPLTKLSDCRDKPGEKGDTWIVLALAKGCLGAPASALPPEKPLCDLFHLHDERSKAPIEGECEVKYLGPNRVIQGPLNVVNGQVPVPTWTKQVQVGCPEYADTAVSPEMLQRKVMVPHGREVEISTVFDEPADDEDQSSSLSTIKVEVRRSVGGYSEDTEIQIDQPLPLGRVPLGDYEIRLSGNDVGTIVDTFTVPQAASPLKLLYRLAPGYCLEVPVACTKGLREVEVDFTLYQLFDNKLPVVWGDVVVKLFPKDKGLWTGRICDLTSGRYELSLRPRRYAPVSRVFEVGGSPDTEPLQLISGTPSGIDVISGLGAPIPDATVSVRWKGAGRSQRITLVTDNDGHASIPALPPDTQLRVAVYHEKYLTETLDGLPGDHLLVVLQDIGMITAMIGGVDCDNAAEQVIAKIWRVAEEGNLQGQKSYRPQECLLEIPVSRNGTYRLTVSGLDFIPFQKELDLVETLGVDLGEIELEQGETLRVLVQHRNQPVPDAEVRLERDGPARLTDDLGAVELPVLGDGKTKVSIVVSHPSFAPRHIVEEIDDENELVVELRRCGEISGVVFTDDGWPAVGEIIYARGASYYEATVDGSGSYRFSCLDPGSWRVLRLQIGGNGYHQMTMGTGDFRDVVVREGEAVKIDFLPAVEVQGRVYIDGALASKVTIGAILLSSDAGSGPAATKLQVNELGSFTGSLPLPGKWTFLCGNLSYVAEVRSCPCIVDLFFTSTQ